MVLEEDDTGGPAGEDEEDTNAAAVLTDVNPELSYGDGFGEPEGQAEDERLADRASSLEDLPAPSLLMYQLLCSLAAACTAYGVSSLALSGQELYARAALFDPFFQPVLQLVEAMMSGPGKHLLPSAVGASIVVHLRAARASVVQELDGPDVPAAASPADPRSESDSVQPARSGLLADLMLELSRAADREAAAAAAAVSVARTPGNLQMSDWEAYIAKVDHRPQSFGCAVEWYVCLADRLSRCLQFLHRETLRARYCGCCGCCCEQVGFQGCALCA